MIQAAATERDLEPEIIVMGTSKLFRVRRVGAVFFIEQDQHRRTTDEVLENWVVFAVAKGPDARNESIGACCEANQKFLEAAMAEHNRKGRPS